MLTIKIVWQSILAAIARFWDNRFQPKQNETVRVLELELERERIEKKQLLEVILSIAAPSPIKQEEEEEVELKPIGQPHWRTRARLLEEQQRQKAAAMRDAKQPVVAKMAKVTTEALEAELGVVNVGNN